MTNLSPPPHQLRRGAASGHALRYAYDCLPWLACLCAAVLLTLSGCGDKVTANTASQVAARVGSDEISVHQINEALSHSNTQGATKQEIAVISRSVLEKLIDQQLALNQAVEAKLNRSPEVVTQIESSRREILASAWVKQLANTLPRPTETETRRYFAEHPYLFSERRVFHVQEIVVPNQPGLAEDLREYTSNSKGIKEAAALLKSRNITFTGGEITRAAEQIPLESLAQIAELRDGQTALIETQKFLTLMRIVASESAPVPETLALPRIAQFIMNQRINSAVAANLKEQRSTNKVQYLGEFVNASLATAETNVFALSSPIQQEHPSAETKRRAVEKGVTGLK